MSGTQSSAAKLQVGLNAPESDGGMAAMMSLMKSTGEAFGMDPRNIQDFFKPRTPEGDRLIMEAHEKARDAMKSICPHLKAGVTLSLHDNQAVPGGEENAEKENDDELHRYLPHLAKDDFIGVQNYTRSVFGPDGVIPPAQDAELTQMGYEFYPQALEKVIRFVHSRTDLPIIVTENGFGNTDFVMLDGKVHDPQRIDFLRRYLSRLKDAVNENIPVIGYLYSGHRRLVFFYP
jgi:beta-glucosidase